MVSTILAVIRISVEGGATSKIGKARFGKCRLTITSPEFCKGPREKNFQKKKIGGRGPTGPPTMVHLFGSKLEVVMISLITYFNG
jgi:hypothetical protein